MALVGPQCNGGCGNIPNLAGITIGAPYDTWWCVQCFSANKHRQPEYQQMLQANTPYAIRFQQPEQKSKPYVSYYRNNPITGSPPPSRPTEPSTKFQSPPPVRPSKPGTEFQRPSLVHPTKPGTGFQSPSLVRPAQTLTGTHQPGTRHPSQSPTTPRAVLQAHQQQAPVNSKPPPSLTRQDLANVGTRSEDQPEVPKIAEYKVGWICAIEVEYVAACEMLDGEFAAPQGVPDDDNNFYTYGRVGQHKVVMACLPRGRYGTTSAASVANNMMRSFPGLRNGIKLMVGIGGGAPSHENDIRLGDVVVSIPAKRSAGVIHYEHGKAIQDKKFERTGSLSPPPTFLLKAINALSVDHTRYGHRINMTVGEMVQRNQRLRSRFGKPETSSDILYKSDYVHRDSKVKCQNLCAISLTNCRIARQQRSNLENDPAIHYGLIASADKLMKDAIVRDTLSASEGILCFEMESAGLMDDFHCLVIRGICDYSDTHKNDAWQGYAAATAAAYAKELLMKIPPSHCT